MDENLIKLLSDQMTPGVLGKLSGVLGESEEATGKAVNAAIPGIMGALMKKGANESGANDLMGMMDNLPGGLDLGNIAGLLGNQDQSKTLLESGNGLVSGLLGGGNNKMFDLISSVSGLGRAKSGNLMGLLMPLAMNMLRGKMRGNGLGAAGLASMLLGQRNFLKAAAPNGLTDALGLASFDDIGANIGNSANVNVGINDAARSVGNTVSGAVEGGTERVRDAAGNVGSNVGGAVKGAGAAVGAGAAATAAAGGKVARGGMGIGRWLLPLIGLLVLAAILWWLFNNFLGGNRNANIDVNNAANNVTSTVDNAADATAGAVSGAANAAGDAVSGAANAAGDAASGVANAAGNAASGAAAAVAGAIPANILSGVCGNISGLTDGLGAFPALTAETETSAVATGVNAIRAPIEAILGAAGESAIPGLGALTEGFNGLRNVVDGITGTTLGASAGAVGTAFEGLKGAGDTFTNGLNCNN